MEKLKTKITYLGYYQLIGGIIGLLFIVLAIVNSGTNAERGIFSLMIPLILFSIYTGKACIDLKRNCLLLSIINQTIQIISISIAGFAFTYHSGVYFNIGLETTDGFLVSFDFGLSTFSFAINSDDENTFISVNLIAFYLLKILTDIQEEFDFSDSSSNEKLLDDNLN